MLKATTFGTDYFELSRMLNFQHPIVKAKIVLWVYERLKLHIFGVCSGACPESKVSFVGEDGETAVGKKCCYMNYDSWQNCKEDSIVDGEAALTTESYLVCVYGGTIKFVTTGQDGE